MIGRQQLQFGPQQFETGMATSAYHIDGMFSPSTSAINPFIDGATLYATAAGTDISTSPLGNIIATDVDSQAVSANNRIMVDDAANFYWFNGTTLTKKHTGSNTYVFGKTDIASVALVSYITSAADIASWNTSTDTLTESWWTGTVTTDGSTHPSALGSTVPHPLLVFDNPNAAGSALWIADGNEMHFYDPVNNRANVGQLVLNTTDRIYALGIDPYTGLMMISIQSTVNLSNNISSSFYVLLYDGFSAKVRRRIPVNDLVTGFVNVEGQVYVGYGTAIGTWNGNGVTFLRKLTSATYGTFSTLPYKHHLSAWNHVLLVADGTTVLAYGVVRRQAPPWAFPSFFPIFTTSNLGVSGLAVTALFPTGGSVIGLAFNRADNSTFHFYTFDIKSKSAGAASAIWSYVFFPRPIFVRRMRVITTGITATTGLGSVSISDENSVLHTPTKNEFVVPTGSTYYTFDFDFSSVEVMAIQPRINIDTQAFGIVHVYIYYDVAQ